MTTNEKLRAWVDANPSGYLRMTLRQIGAEVGVSPSSVGRELPKIIADRDGIMPSDVVAKRETLGYKRTPRKLSPEDIADIHSYSDDGWSVKDIAYILNHNENTVRKYLAERKNKESHSTQS